MKISPIAIIRAHRRTYVNAATGRRSRADYLLFEVLPIEVAIFCVLWPVQLSAVASAALLTVSGLAGAILFGFLLQVSQRALDWADANPHPGLDTSEHADYLAELAANSAYASLVCLTAAAFYLIATVSSDRLLAIASGISIGLTVHLALVLLMVLKRVYSLTQQRLIRARTGAGRHRKAS